MRWIDGNGWRVGVERHIVEGEGPGRAVDGENLDWPSRRGDGLAGPGEERGGGDEHASAGVLELEGQLLRRICGVHRRQHGAQPHDGVEHDRVLGHVGRVDGDHRALGDAAGGETRGEPPNALQQLAVADAAARRAVDERRAIGVGAGLRQDEVRQRHIGDRDGGKRAAKHHVGSPRFSRSVGIIVPRLGNVEPPRTAQIRYKVRT